MTGARINGFCIRPHTTPSRLISHIVVQEDHVNLWANMVDFKLRTSRRSCVSQGTVPEMNGNLTD